MSLILLILGWVNFLLFWLSLYKVRHNKAKVELIYWAIPLGAFTWEDLLVFSLFNLLAAIVVLLARDLRLGLLILIVFWSVRNLGEILYWLGQQFCQPTVYPHNQYQDLKFLQQVTGKISLQQLFIIMQVLHQALLVISLVALVLLLIHWEKLISWF